MLVDAHQHVWTQPLLDALAARDMLPLVRHEAGLTVLHSAAEQPYLINVALEVPAQRAACVREDGLDRSLVRAHSD
jgi:hypothetical protein